jgi:hypothetical protein
MWKLSILKVNFIWEYFANFNSAYVINLVSTFFAIFFDEFVIFEKFYIYSLQDKKSSWDSFLI